MRALVLLVLLAGCREKEPEPARMRFLSAYTQNGAPIPEVVYDTQAKQFALRDGGSYSAEEMERRNVRDMVEEMRQAVGAPPDATPTEIGERAAEILRRK